MSWIAPQTLNQRGILGMNRRNIEFISGYNDRRQFPLVDNKLTTKLLAEEEGLAVPRLLGVVDTQHAIQQIDGKLRGLEDFVAKPAQGSGGKGILVIKGRIGEQFVKSGGDSLSLSDVQRHLTNIISGLHSLGGRTDIAFLEERVQTDPMFESLSRGGVPDVRLIVFCGFPVMGMLRLATSASDGKANLHQGAIGVGLNLADGRAIRAVSAEQLIETHPDTGADLSQVQIPDWANLMHLAARCSEVTGLGYLGCDIVIDRNKGPLILELNARPGLSIQIANNHGLLPRLRHIQRRLAKDKKVQRMAIQERVDYAMTTLSGV